MNFTCLISSAKLLHSFVRRARANFDDDPAGPFAECSILLLSRRPLSLEPGDDEQSRADGQHILAKSDRRIFDFQMLSH